MGRHAGAAGSLFVSPEVDAALTALRRLTAMLGFLALAHVKVVRTVPPDAWGSLSARRLARTPAGSGPGAFPVG